MRTIFAFCAVAMLGVGCSSTTLDCQTVTCSTNASLTYQLCANVDTAATYKYGGSSCSCSGYDTSACMSCTAKVSTYCGVAPTPDLSVAQDLSLPIEDLATKD